MNAIITHAAFVIAPVLLVIFSQANLLGPRHNKCYITYLITFIIILKGVVVLSSCKLWDTKAMKILSNLLKHFS